MWWHLPRLANAFLYWQMLADTSRPLLTLADTWKTLAYICRLPTLADVCQHLSTLASTCCQHLPALAYTCRHFTLRHLLILAGTCWHFPVLAGACRHLSALARICWHLLTFAGTCRQLRPFAETCRHLPALTYPCWLACTCLQLLTLVDTSWQLTSVRPISQKRGSAEPNSSAIFTERSAEQFGRTSTKIGPKSLPKMAKIFVQF